MESEVKLVIDVADLKALVQSRYKVDLVDREDGKYDVGGLPLAVGKIHGALKRAHKALR
jgi:hypothetical protein